MMRIRTGLCRPFTISIEQRGWISSFILQEAAIKGLEDSLFGSKIANELQTNQTENDENSVFDEKDNDMFY